MESTFGECMIKCVILDDDRNDQCIMGTDFLTHPDIHAILNFKENYIEIQDVKLLLKVIASVHPQRELFLDAQNDNALKEIPEEERSTPTAISVAGGYGACRANFPHCPGIGLNFAPLPAMGKQHRLPYINRNHSRCDCSTTINQMYRHYVYGQKVIVRTDHKPIEWLKDEKHRNLRLQCFAISLQDYDYKVEYVEGENIVTINPLNAPGRLETASIRRLKPFIPRSAKDVFDVETGGPHLPHTSRCQ
uniref:Reverse transcriptase RNase H-like domain-containing protein n=1 Tax=Romanomermis culicivorax TaxID=13658 RepID=A0A915JJJ2_ROMCU